MPDKILVFLDDLLNTIDNDVIRKKCIEEVGAGPPSNAEVL